MARTSPSPQPSPRSAGRGSLPLCLVLLAAQAWAGSRPQPGGKFALALVSPSPAVDVTSAESPVDALRLSLTHQPLCRLATFSRPDARTLRLTTTLDVALIREALSRGGALTTNLGQVSATSTGVDVQLTGPAPDVELTLCHPRFFVPVSPFKANGGKLEAFDAQPLGRPYFDEVTLQATDARGAERLLTSRRVHAAAGLATESQAPQRFVTALVLGADDAHLRAAVEHSVEREDLARFFVPAPSAALHGLLPGTPATPRPAKPAPLATARALTLRFDDSRDHEKQLAARLQLKLQPFGYRVALKAGTSTTLNADEVALRSVVLPPSTSGSLLLWLELTGRGARAREVLDALATQPVEAVTAKLAAELPIIPLVSRGLGLRVSSTVHNLRFDELGLPRFDDAFFATE